MPKIIRKYVNNRIKKSRILHLQNMRTLFPTENKDLDGNQAVQGLLRLVSDHGVPLQERSLGPAFTIFKFVSFEVCPLLLVRGSKERSGCCIFQFFSEQSAITLFSCGAIKLQKDFEKKHWTENQAPVDNTVNGELGHFYYSILQLC